MTYTRVEMEMEMVVFELIPCNNPLIYGRSCGIYRHAFLFLCYFMFVKPVFDTIIKCLYPEIIEFSQTQLNQ